MTLCYHPCIFTTIVVNSISDGSYQIKAKKEVLIGGLLLPSLPYPKDTLVWIWTCKKAEGLKHQTITGKTRNSLPIAYCIHIFSLYPFNLVRINYR